MKKGLLILNLFIYYIIGFFLFSIISYITHIILTAILMESVIFPLQEISQISEYLMCFLPLYLIIYTLIYFLVLYFNYKYDIYIIKKLNEKLEETRGGDRSEKK
ncbi:MAG: hypothetical protein HFJ34_08795 [Clostridia bacterium]|nr:hypothetical protein [Clostridia bacterium]